VLVGSWSRRFAAGLTGGVLLSTLLVPLSASPSAAASPPPSLGLSDTAQRDFGNGLTADKAATRVGSGAMAVGPDGRVVFYDPRARELRAVDPVTKVVSVLAGNALAPDYATCTIDTTQAPTAKPLGQVAQLWIVSNDDVYAQVQGGEGCSVHGDLYRLAAADGRWHLALKNPATCCYPPSGAYWAFAVAGDGSVVAWDRGHSVIRRFGTGADPYSSGTAVAGVLDTPGSAFDGEGGPATSAHLGELSNLVASTDGSFAFTTTFTVRRVDTDGVLTTVAGNGLAPPAGDPTVDAGLAATSARVSPYQLMVSPTDPTQLYVLNNPGGGKLAWQSFTVGGPLLTVAGSRSSSTFYGPTCIGPGAAALAGDQLLFSCSFGIYSLPVDGSTPLADGTRVAGIDDGKGKDVSPDGVTLGQTFLPVTSVAEAPDGSFAIASGDKVRTLTGLGVDDTVGTLASVPGASTVAYAADGTLYVTDSGVTGHGLVTYAVTAAGVVIPVLGGGTSAPVEGALGTTVQSVTTTALDADNGLLYFGMPSPVQVWAVTLATGTMHRVLGNDGSGVRTEGAPALDVPLSYSASRLSVNPVTHALYVTVGSIFVYRVDEDGTFHDLTEPDGGLYLSVVGLPNGQLVKDSGQHGLETVGLDDARADVLQNLSAMWGTTSTSQVIGRPSAGLRAPEYGGLLTLSDPVSAPSFPEASPSVQVTPGVGTLTLSVTPPAGSAQRLTWYVAEVPIDGRTPSFTFGGTLAHDGSMATYERTFTKVGNVPFIAGHHYRFFMRPYINDFYGYVAAPPVTVDAEPLPDTTAPAAPVLTASPNGSSVSLHITVPADADFDHVVWMGKPGDVAPTGPADATAGTTVYGTTTTNVSADPARPFTFAAVAYDSSGNASTVATATRPAPTLTTGAAAIDVRYAAGSGCSWVLPGDAILVRYAAGTSSPATPADGVGVNGGLSTAWGSAYCVPVANGAKVALSLFAWTDWSMSRYRRTSFVLTGGLSGDTATLVATSLVSYGGRPAVSATLSRTFATGGTRPLASHAVDLYRRPVGTSTWVKVGSVVTSSIGTAVFTAPIPSGHVDYQVRSAGIVSTVVLSAVKRTSVRQSVTLAQSATSVRHGYAVTLSGVLGPKRATRVYLQRYVSGKWVNLTYLNSSTIGAYKFVYKPAVTGTYLLRTSVLATTTLLAGTSVSRTVKAT
jgi:hypothetical protein